MPAVRGAPPRRHPQAQRAQFSPPHQPRRRRDPDADDKEYAQRQLDGLKALIAIAEPETRLVPFSGAALQLRYTGEFRALDHRDRRPARPAQDAPPPGRVPALLSFIRTDAMLRNSLYLILNMGVQGAFGFAFLVIAAHYFSTTSIGQASSLISASTLIAFTGLFGLNTTLVKFLPTSRHPNNLITAALTVAAGCSGLIAVFYVILLPFVSKPNSFVTHNLPMAIGFVVLTAFGGINLVTDSIFIAAGRSKYTAVVDGVVGGLAKIALVVILAGAGTYAVFGAAAGGFLAAALASIWLMFSVLRWRPAFSGFNRVLKPILTFSGMNYVGNILNMLPALVVPLIVVTRAGPSAAAYYYVSYQLASLLYSAAYSVENSFLAEASQTGTVSRAILVRSGRILIALCVSSFVAVLLFGHLILSAFGSNYGAAAQSSLVPLTAAVLPLGVYYWCLTVLRLTNQLRAVVWCNAVYAAAIIGSAFVLAPRGLEAVATAWPIGTTVGAIAAGAATIGALRGRAHHTQGSRRTREYKEAFR